MAFNHEAIAALPAAAGSDANKALIRAAIIKRTPYTLADSESAGDFKAVDPDAGTIPLYIVQNGTLFKYDPLDTTTTASATCLVTGDTNPKRYKSGGVDYPYSVLDKDLTAQPVSPAPTVGDRYIVPTAATGTDWVGKDGKIAIYLASGWHFETVPVGRPIFVEDEDAFYHRNSDGDWTIGFGNIPFSAGSVPITAVIGAKASFIIKVENQTTNAPPGSPVAPVAYIIGSSPTGDWAGHAGKLAICLADGTFTIITPDTGDVVYDKALDGNYKWTGTAWTPAAGVWVDFPDPVFTEGSTNSSGGNSGTNYTHSNSTAPTTAQRVLIDANTIVYSARRAGAKIRISYRANVAISNTTSVTLGILRDAETNAIDWQNVRVDDGFNCDVVGTFLISAVNVNSRTYKIGIWPNTAGTLSMFGRRLLTLEGGA